MKQEKVSNSLTFSVDMGFVDYSVFNRGYIWPMFVEEL